LNRILADTVYRYAYLPIISAWLFTFSFIFSNYFSYSTSPAGVQRILQQQLQRQELAFANVLTDTSLLYTMSLDSLGEADMQRLSAQEIGIFLYRRVAGATPVLRYWNTQRSIPLESMLEGDDEASWVEMPNGQYLFLRRRVLINGSPDWLLCGLLPVRMDYFVENDYLRKGFVGAPDVEANYRISTSVKDIPIRNIDGQIVYRIERKPEATEGGGGWLVILLRLLGTLLICFYLHMTALGFGRQQGPFPALVFLIAAIVLLRGGTYLLPASMVYGGVALFDPAMYQAGKISRSLGDLLVNTLLFVWVVLLAQSFFGHVGMPKPRTRLRALTRAALGALFLVVITWLAGDVVRRLVSDSDISYDVTDFFRMDGYTVAGFFTIVCLSMGYYILSQMIFERFQEPVGKGAYTNLLVTAGMGLLLIVLCLPAQSRGFGMALWIWLLLYQWLSFVPFFQGKGQRMGQHIVGWLVFYAASISTILFTENQSREMERRELAATQLAMQVDPSGEYLVDIAVKGISNALILSNIDRFRNPGLSQRLKDSLVAANYSGYTNRFDTRLYLFDADGSVFSPADRWSYDTLQALYTFHAKPTKVAGMRYYEKDFTSFSYIYRREVRDQTSIARAIMYMVSSPRRFREEALYPELIRQPKGSVLDGQSGYAYAVYDSLRLKLSRNDFDFPVRLASGDVPLDRFHWRTSDGFDILWHRAGGGKVVVIARRSRYVLEAITLFGYVFCASLLWVALFQLASYLVKFRFDLRSILPWLRGISIRRQIHGTVILFTLFSFLVIGASTIYFFIARYDTGNREMLSRSLQSMSADFGYRLAALGSDTGASLSSKMQILAQEISEAHNADINVYNAAGALLASSQPFVYGEGILNRRMNPTAYWKMQSQGKVQFLQTEDYGQLSYLSIYRPLQLSGSVAQVYLNIPYFASNRGLKQEISGFLVALINLNTFIFLIGGIISVLITNKITRSLTWIGRRMEELSLMGHNEEIAWDRTDEIGVLVKQYNQMVHKLEASAAALAIQEREGAWREMAQQVAHEIKNPLTPMKLSIQRLQMAIDAGDPNVQEMSARMASNLIEHIEHLSHIASDFAEFANIGQSNNLHFDLRVVISSVASLFGINGGEVQCDLPLSPIPVFADKTQMNRLFTNLVRNALEAIPKDREPLVRIKATLEATEVSVLVEDNGDGIPDEVRPQIFHPRFTTKTSGTGLGLAMCRSIVEKTKGRIHFQSNDGLGTTFFIHLPIHLEETTAIDSPLSERDFSSSGLQP